MNILRILREKKGVSQESVALAMNVTPATISRWETGEFFPRADKLLALAKVLDCSVDELLKGGLDDADKTRLSNS